MFFFLSFPYAHSIAMMKEIKKRMAKIICPFENMEMIIKTTKVL